MCIRDRFYIEGQAVNWGRPAVAVVGTRNPTPSGEEFAFLLAYGLAQQGIIVVSGLARGIDSAAHEGALAAGGQTVAVCATGLDSVYPRENRRLAARIKTGGSLLSEFQIGTTVRRHHFPQRNRLISGLTQGTVVVEAGSRSGSLITARMAAEQGRTVFAVPGSVSSPLSKGVNALHRAGARLLEKVADITDELSEKKLIRDTIKKVENEISKAEKKFNKNDKKDLEEIPKKVLKTSSPFYLSLIHI